MECECLLYDHAIRIARCRIAAKAEIAKAVADVFSVVFFQCPRAHVGGVRLQGLHLHQWRDVQEPSGSRPVYIAFQFPNGNLR